MLQVPEWLQWTVGHETMHRSPRGRGRQWAAGPESSQSQAGTAQFPKWLQWAMRSSKSHEERQVDGHTKRPCCRSPKAAGPRQGATWQTRNRDTDRHAMKSEVGYLFSGL